MDRISALPDDIIRQIIDRSESPNKLSCLSKTWNQILLSYPIFKFDYSALRSKQPDTRIASAESSKIFLQRLANTTNSSAESIRIKTCLHDDGGIPDFGFLDDMFDSITRVSPREIDFDISTLSDFHDWPTLYSIPLGLFLHSNIQFLRRLTVLKLKGCNFHDYRFITNTNLFEGFGISLKVLRLELINFMYCKMRILDAMVACASRLETLELYNVRGTDSRVTNHPSLKSVKIYRSGALDISGAPSLETLRIDDGSFIRYFRVSSTPNLKVLHIENCCDQALKNGNLLKFISDIPSLESATYVSFYHKSIKKYQKFTIVRTDKLVEVELKWWRCIVEIEASELTRVLTHFLTMLAKRKSSFMKIARLLFGLSLLSGLSRFRVTLHVAPPPYPDHIFYYEFTNKLSITLTIEHLKFPSSSVSSQDHFLDVMLHMCHPKFISFIGEEDHIPNIDFQRALQDSCKQLVERSCCARRRSLSNSWHGQLKDVTLVTRSTNGCIREDKVVDISGDVVSSLVEGDRVSFMLTWD